ncbi:MAG: hypothetical protein OEZ03_09800, partial [Alphaproteobacteria bacterium]|nr:hypothetical protein [Alphaproteobacteria bacterium]
MSKLKASFFLKTAVFLLAAFVLAVSPASVGAEETCKPELSFADPPIARDYRIWSQYRYHGSNSGVIWCGENAIIYGIRSFRDKHGMFPDREPAADPVILWRDLASGEVQTVVSGRRVLDEMDEYDSAGTPL